MGFSSPLQDVKGYSTTRPPLVIFMMCLMLFACAMLTMAFYVQYADTVLNPEVKLKWKKLLSHLDSLHLCTYAEEQGSEEEILALSQFIDGGSYNASSNDNTVSITVAALVLVRELQKLPVGMVAVTGKIEIDGFPENRDSATSLNMTFVLPRNLTASRYKDTCVILTGPSWLRPFSRRSNVCVPSSINRTITHVGSLVPKKGNDTSTSCKTGSPIRLSYSNQAEEEFFLSKEEKWKIYSRLIHASYFLFVIGVTFICYCLIRGRMYTSVVKVDKVIG